MKEIQLTKGYVALVDDEDYEWLNSFKWCVSVQRSGHIIPLKRKSGSKNSVIKMSRMIMGVTDPNIFVDHKDRNPLNNQRSNLRTCTRSENQWNKGRDRNSISQYIGVSVKSRGKRWFAQIKKNYKHYNLGTYHTEIEAALAYNKAAKELHGEFATLNIIP